ncbi:MAG: hypothetical protein GY941_11515 [Planctomycetes bacterium]|nr:hypothetical protein [Planctomycetota bacterium]
MAVSAHVIRMGTPNRCTGSASMQPQSGWMLPDPVHLYWTSPRDFTGFNNRIKLRFWKGLDKEGEGVVVLPKRHSNV